MDKIKNLSQSLNLNSTEVSIIETLVKDGATSVQTLAQKTGLGRTAIYSTIKKLQDRFLVVELVNSNGRLFDANLQNAIDLTIQDKKSEIKSLESELPDLIQSLAEISQTNVSKSEIKYYEGQKGLEQVTWNSTKAIDVFRIYEIDDIDTLVGQEFADLTMIEYANKKIFDKQLTNQKKFDACSTNPLICDFIDNWWEGRYVDPAEIKIDFETMLYNDVYCAYEYQDGNIFCFEIYNEKLAETQKEIFDFIYNRSKPLRKLDSFATAIIDE